MKFDALGDTLLAKYISKHDSINFAYDLNIIVLFRKLYYCNEACQAEDWPSHKRWCWGWYSYRKSSDREAREERKKGKQID